jgi:N-acetyl-anhydromuramyl-L-alanine amidase AmpD
MLPSHCYSSREIKPWGEVIHWISGKYAFPEDPFNPDFVIALIEDMNREPKDRVTDLYEGPRVYASYHKLITTSGQIISLVPENKKAWHAGKSRMEHMEKDDLNMWAIGTALIGMKGDSFPDKQMWACCVNSAQLMGKYKYPLDNIMGHDEVRTQWNLKYPRDKGKTKDDPGTYTEQFNWFKHRAGVTEVLYS